MDLVNSKRVYILCSSPNLRGIHSYAINSLDLFPNSVLLVPPGDNRILWLLWELFYPPFLLLFLRDSAFIFANTRISPLAFLIRSNNRLICILHDFMDTSLVRSPESRGLSVKRLLNSYLISTSLRNAHSVISNSHSTRAEFIKIMPTRQHSCHVLHPQLSFRPDLVTSILQNLRSGQNSLYSDSEQFSSIYLSVTGTTPNKSPHSYHQLVESLSSNSDGKVLYYLVGIPPDSSIIRSINALMPRLTIKSLYRVSDFTLLNLYLLSDSFISLSNQEGFGIPLHDALAFDVPAYVTLIPSFQEISSLHPTPDITYFYTESITQELPFHLNTQTQTRDRLTRALLRSDNYLKYQTMHTAHLHRQARAIVHNT